MSQQQQELDPNRFYGLTYEEYAALTPTERRHAKVEFEQAQLAMQREESRARAEAISKANADRAAERQAEEQERLAEQRERSKANAKRAYFAAHPDATEQEFEASHAALLQQRGVDAVVEQRGQLRAFTAKRIAKGI